MERCALTILETAKQIISGTADADFAALPVERKGELLKLAEDEMLKVNAIEHVDQSWRLPRVERCDFCGAGTKPLRGMITK